MLITIQMEVKPLKLKYNIHNRISPIHQKMVDLRECEQTFPSICIPRLYYTFTEELITSIINEMKLGYISRVDMIYKTHKDGSSYFKTYIHFFKWSWNKCACEYREKLIKGSEVKIVYNDPYYFNMFSSEPINNPPLTPINKPLNYMEYENDQYYKEYCNHFQKMRIFNLNELIDIDTKDKEHLILPNISAIQIIPSIQKKSTRPKSAVRNNKCVKQNKQDSNHSAEKCNDKDCWLCDYDKHIFNV